MLEMETIKQVLMRPRNTVQPSFLELPAEIRNQIYDLVFADVDQIVIPLVRRFEGIREKIKREAHGKRRHTVIMSLSQTCRQVRAETFQYYGEVSQLRFNMYPIRTSRRGVLWLNQVDYLLNQISTAV